MAKTSAWPIELVAAAELMVSAADLARSLERSTWDFAVEIEELKSIGVSHALLRWLVCQGLVEHAIELVPATGGERQFRFSGQLTFGRRTCCVLTDSGYCKASTAITSVAPLSRRVHGPNGSALSVSSSKSTTKDDQPRSPAPKPDWNEELGRLTMGDTLIKELQGRADNQRRILSAFHEDRWPERIDDPLPPKTELEPKKRLKEAIAALNRNQVNRLIQFLGDGQGLGVRWRLVEDSAKTDRHQPDPSVHEIKFNHIRRKTN
jgi:hypothetical protein